MAMVFLSFFDSSCVPRRPNRQQTYSLLCKHGGKVSELTCGGKILYINTGQKRNFTRFVCKIAQLNPYKSGDFLSKNGIERSGVTFIFC